MDRQVVLHGYFAKFHEGPITVTGNTVAEIVEGVTRQLPGFTPHPRTGRHRIKIVGCTTEDDLYRDLGDQTEIHIVPQLNGGKDQSPLLQIALGLALVGVGFMMGPASWMGSMVMKVGAMAVLGGLAQLLAPQPESDKDEKDRSRYLGAPRNTVEIGTRIPILYGRHQVYGHFLSFDINAQEFKGSASGSSGSNGGK